MKNVLLLGDSIRQGYCHYVKEGLKDIAEVCYPWDNSQYTQYTLVSLSRCLELGDPHQVNVIHWNNGHWDIGHWDKEKVPLNSPEQYAVMLERIHHRLCVFYPNAKIIFALTTPLNPDGNGSGDPRPNREVELYNSVAGGLMVKLGVGVNDLYSVLKDKAASFYIDHVHLTENGYQLLGKAVVKAIKANL
ncbi:MAG: SGNH/GDSL hydrolase family protein [Victivallales bacterium]